MSGSFAIWLSALGFLAFPLLGTWHTAKWNRSQLTFLHILVLATAGSWVSYAATAFPPNDLSVPYYKVEAPLLTLTQSIVGCLVAIIVFNFISKKTQTDKSRYWLTDLIDKAQTLPLSVIFLLLGIHIGLIAYSFSLGMLMSSTGGVMATASAFQSAILQFMGTVNGAITVLSFTLLLGKNKNRRKIGIAILTLQLAFAFLGGRRVFFGVVLLGGFLWVVARSLNATRLLTLSGLVVLVAAFTMPAFLMLRSTAQQEGILSAPAEERPGILVRSGAIVASEFSFESAFNERYEENLQNRLSFQDWTVTIQSRILEGRSTREGEIAATTILEMVPRVIWPQKLEYLGNMQIEQKIQHWFLMPDIDGASTFLGYAIGDGGFVGVFIYFAFFGATLSALMRFITTGNFTISRLWATGAMFSICYNIEAGFVDVIGTARMLIVMFILDWQARELIGQPKIKINVGTAA